MQGRLPHPNPSQTSPRKTPAQCQWGLHPLRKSRDGSRLRPAIPMCSTAAPPRRLLLPLLVPTAGSARLGSGEGCHPSPGTGSQPCRGAAPPASTWEDERSPHPCVPTHRLSSLPCRTPASKARPARPGAGTSLGGERCAELDCAGPAAGGCCGGSASLFSAPLLEAPDGAHVPEGCRGSCGCGVGERE